MKLRSIRPALLPSLFLVAMTAGGCVQRRLTLTSEPSNAIVYMNDKEVGRTPIETDFIWYGKYDVQVRKEGYLTLDKPQRLKTPWWQYPPIDLFAEMMPWHPTDRQALHFVLEPRPTTLPSPEAMISRAAVMRPMLESTRYPAPSPATQPATKPATTRPAGQIVTQPTVQPSTQP